MLRTDMSCNFKMVETVSAIHLRFYRVFSRNEGKFLHASHTCGVTYSYELIRWEAAKFLTDFRPTHRPRIASKPSCDSKAGTVSETGSTVGSPISKSSCASLRSVSPGLRIGYIPVQL